MSLYTFKTVIDDGRITQTITSHCGCTIKSNFTGEITIRNDNSWCPAFYVFDDKGRFNETICDHKRAHFFKQVNQNDEIKLVLISKTSSQSGNPDNIVEIYADSAGSGFFSITCGSTSESITKTTRPTFVTGTNEAFNKGTRKALPTRSAINKVTSVAEPDTNFNDSKPEFPSYNKGTRKALPTRSAINNLTSVTEPDKYGPYLNASKSEFPYMYAVVAGCIVVVAIIIYVFICKRRKNRAQNTSKEEGKEDRTYNNATNGIERPENGESSKQQQQLPDNPLYHSYLVNEDCGYSACGNESFISTEQLPYNPLYHSYQANGGKVDSKYDKDEARTLLLQGSNAVYAQPNKLARASIVNHNDSNESQIENVYAQVNKTNET
uniref:Uncharacterized protein LOC111103718 n=1 Tax=Crassostrea virginica TaxID=6565 RepID=A0A8B8ARP3_CRAVI|nr:uncharacterized protein LOC111103718 [Crassostrea virginica]